MENAAAFKATFHNTKLVMGRSVLQIILEVPIENQKQVYDALGYPNPAQTCWVGVAKLQAPAE